MLIEHLQNGLEKLEQAIKQLEHWEHFQTLDGPSLTKEEEKKFKSTQRKFDQKQVEVSSNSKGERQGPFPNPTERIQQKENLEAKVYHQ